MKFIRDILARDLGQRIEEIIKVDQNDEQTVYTEIKEYIATERIKGQYTNLFRAIAEAPADPHEGIGVWISGFFGSGKSSFVKNIGYVLSKQQVLSQSASTLFKEQVEDVHISQLVDFINARIPTEVIMFDVSVDRAVRRSNERIAEIMYTVLLRELDYAEDYDVADLEITLEKEGRLEEFIILCSEMYHQEWHMIRKGALKISRASAIIHVMEPATFPHKDAWSQSLRGKSADITVGEFVRRSFELCAMRRPGKALVFIIDEVGQYVARSGDKIEDLRAVVEQFGLVSKNLLKARKIVAPAWVMVTSQEKLDEVVSALDSKRVELAKLQDRFRHRIDLAPADIREVATRRVLAKKPEAELLLKQLFNESHGLLNTACHLERTTRKSQVSQEDFVQFYPYLPHFVELSIDIVSGIRLQPGANKHIGGSNRTIIKQAYEMLVSERTHLASQPIGTLVTLDKIYDLVEGNLSSEKQKDVSDITHRFGDDLEDQSMTTRVAKTLCLLEFVRDLPRSQVNIAACLVDTVGKLAPLSQVSKALEKLRAAQFVRHTEEGWKMQTAQEKNWDTERRAFSPRPKDHNDILREMLQDTLSDRLKSYRFHNLKSFRISIRVDGVLTSDEGQIQLSVQTAEDNSIFQERVTEVRNESRQDSNKNNAYWVFALTSEIDDLTAMVYASRQMVTKYDQLSAQGRATPEESTSLSQERTEVVALQRRLREKITRALESGIGLFKGVAKEADTLGNDIGEMLRKFFDSVMPDLYPKLEMGIRDLRGTEAGDILKAANLNALPQVFYPSAKGLSLVVEKDGKYVPNADADIAKEILDYLKHEQAYGNKVTGKSIEEHFQGIGYGWDRDMLRLVLATLLRAGSIEVVYQGRRFRNHQDPQCRVPFENNVAFKAASFAPRESVGLRTLTSAVRYFEEITGEEVDIEEGAIASALKRMADEETKRSLRVIAEVRANQLPALEVLEEYQHTLENILLADSDDCVRLLAGEGRSFKDSRNKVRAIREAIDEKGLSIIRQARTVVNEMWPALEQQAEKMELQEKAVELYSLIKSSTFFEQLDRIADISQEISSAYHHIYLALHEQRADLYATAIEGIKGRPEYGNISDEIKEMVLLPLSSRMCKRKKSEEDKEHVIILPAWSLTCQFCSATLRQIDSDIAAVDGLKRQVVAHIQELTTPVQEVGQRIERVKIVDFFDSVLESDQDVDEFVERLKAFLLKKVAEGSRIIVE